MSPKVSVAVPIYNAEKYLRQCLDSIASQSLADIEIICVNDGSTDDSLSIMEEYAARDSRFKVISKPNAGYGHSMNQALDAATGEYFGIVDSDDYIAEDMYMTLYDAAKRNELDFVRSDYCYLYTTNKKQLIKNRKSISNYYNRVYCPRETPQYFFSRVVTPTGIYKLNFIRKHGIRYNESPGASFQDQGFWFKTNILAERVMFVPKVYYTYRVDNPNSSTNDVSKIPCMALEYDFISEFAHYNATQIPNIGQFYWKARYQNCLSICDKLGKHLKPSDIQSIGEDLKRAQEANEFDTALFTTGQIRDVEKIIASPQDFCAQRKKMALAAERDLYIQLYCNGKPGIWKRLQWSIQDYGIKKTLLRGRQKAKQKVKKIKPAVKEWLKKINPVYQSVKSFERGTAARLNEIDYKNELFFWWSMNRPGESLSETKKRVFLNLPRAEGMLRETQLQFAEILKEFNQLMEDYSIPYWLTSGTLLGAVRHHGFIPWDDDLDINMLDDDRERFFEIVNQSDKLQVQYVYWTDSSYGIQRFPQVRFKYSSIPVWIDVYFWVSGNNEPMWDEGLWKKRTRIINKRKSSFYAARKNLHKQVYRGVPIEDKHDREIIESIFDNSYTETLRICQGSGKTIFLTPEIRSVDKKPMVFEYTDILPVTTVEFEGQQYPAPKETEKFLITQFEDWLTFPRRVTKTHK